MITLRPVGKEKQMRMFLEAAGCLTANFLISAIKESGNECIASDANPNSIGRYLADEFVTVPFAKDDNYADVVLKILVDKKVDMVIPTLDDALMKWALMKDRLSENGITLAISDASALEICLDKWNTYRAFKSNGIPTPETSLKQDYPLVKPRNGRGGSGVSITDHPVDMKGMLSQELLNGDEYTIDVFINSEHKPVYIVPRLRMGIKDGKSTGGVVIENQLINEGVEKICKAIPLKGAVNIQCFVNGDSVKFTEINPRFGGGTVLGMKATENWIPLIVDTFKDCKAVHASKQVEYGLKMGRYYAEIFYK